MHLFGCEIAYEGIEGGWIERRKELRSLEAEPLWFGGSIITELQRLNCICSVEGIPGVKGVG